jgi:hypothetical protein
LPVHMCGSYAQIPPARLVWLQQTLFDPWMEW